MNRTIPFIKIHLLIPQRVTVIIVILLAMLTGVSYADDFDSYAPTTAEELVEVINQVNANPGVTAMISLEGIYTFTKLIGLTGSPLPWLEDRNIIWFINPDTEFIWKPDPNDPSPDTTSFLYQIRATPDPDDIQTLEDGLWYFVSGGSLRPLKLKDPVTQQTQRDIPSVPADMASGPPMFQGFDTIFDVTNALVAFSGISADCGEQCVLAENSRVIAASSRLACDDECLRFNVSSASNRPINLEAVRAAISGSDISSADKAEALRQVDQAGELFGAYDIAVVDSKLNSQNATMMVSGTISEPNPARILVDRSLLRTNSSAARALQIKNTGDKNHVFDTVLSGPTSRQELLQAVYGTVTARNLFVDRGWNGISILDGAVNLGLSAISTQGRDPDDFEPACEFGFGSDRVYSVGYNIVADDTCVLDGPGDLENTDPGLFLPDDGSLIPQFTENSPAIDGGPMEVVDGLLPCGTTDITGLPRPQDGNGDAVFECDVGPVELKGSGDIEAGHSGAFYNELRNGEGNYVEILSDDLAVVYTFTYRPDGSGPAWFIGVGDIRDNGIVIDELLRPTGTSFGNGFDPAAIDYSDAGGMSVVFPDCDAGGSGGSVAYTGKRETGYEGVLSRTQRLTSITGCDTVPAANAGLSGSFYDPARNGEGLIVEWLSTGDVAAIFFTFDQNGDQFWTFGVGTPTDKSVTISALYPAASTVWGQNFNADDVDLQPWGTFELNWINCNSMIFDYNSTVSGYGSGSLDYTRISTLQSTSCPDF